MSPKSIIKFSPATVFSAVVFDGLKQQAENMSQVLTLEEINVLKVEALFFPHVDCIKRTTVRRCAR